MQPPVASLTIFLLMSVAWLMFLPKKKAPSRKTHADCWVHAYSRFSYACFTVVPAFLRLFPYKRRLPSRKTHANSRFACQQSSRGPVHAYSRFSYACFTVVPAFLRLFPYKRRLPSRKTHAKSRSHSQGLFIECGCLKRSKELDDDNFPGPV